MSESGELFYRMMREKHPETFEREWEDLPVTERRNLNEIAIAMVVERIIECDTDFERVVLTRLLSNLMEVRDDD